MADQTAYEGTPGWESIRHLTREWLESRFGSHNDPPDEANQGSHIGRNDHYDPNQLRGVGNPDPTRFGPAGNADRGV